MAAPPRRLVVLENAQIDAMAADPAFAAAFPNCLGPVRDAPPARGCGRCGRAAGKDASAYNAAKECLAMMPQADRDRLKEMLGAATVRVAYARGGRVSTVDF